MENSEKAIELLKKLNPHITTIHLDMGGKHKYALNPKAHEIITEIKAFLYSLMRNDE